MLYLLLQCKALKKQYRWEFWKCEHCVTCSYNVTPPFSCRYSVVAAPTNIIHTKITKKYFFFFLNAGTWKSNTVFWFSKIIASQSLGCVCDSLFSWWLPLKCKTAIKWVWDSSCSCRGLVSWHHSQTQNTSTDRQPIRSSHTGKLLY